MSSRTVETLLVLVVFLLALLVDMLATYLSWQGVSTGFADLAATIVAVLTGGYLALAVVAFVTEGDDDPTALIADVLAGDES
ncbi:hypothetical protein [Haloarchaeobius sp. HME9146]|uniref:hypothetical protein n=1 Tax=Haloarchaeobius sp. HME9146 TaxID=2978732 RepID=UPI0021BE77EB|nr:hypothetical protein [Haloarchaeobius sp. HME9146]MCT9095900.1 hypothetical protein [Haloarchaeobius sp. HME9146]